ncbi:non-homologous end-joining DNA ligase [Salinifilum ghardaiensis]
MSAKNETLEVEGRQFELSNSDKLLYPDDGCSKRDVVEYFRGVAPTMVPHLRGRPLTLRRFPDGIGAKGFFQKEASAHFPEWMRVEPVPQASGGAPVHHVVCDDAASLVYLATQACLEFHVFLSTMDDLDAPVVAVVDLDPPADAGLPELRSITTGMCDRFRDAGLAPHVQATGGKGFHVTAPLTGEASFDEVREQIREMADAAAREDPERLTTKHRKDERGDRVFLDTNRNAYGQTVIAPYSLRARPGAPAATPLDLAEVPGATPNGYGLRNVHRRLAQKRDPWARLSGSAATPHVSG